MLDLIYKNFKEKLSGYLYLRDKSDNGRLPTLFGFAVESSYSGSYLLLALQNLFK